MDSTKSVYQKYFQRKNSFWIFGQSKFLASDFEPPPRRKNSARQRAKNSEFIGGIRRESLGRASRVPQFGFKKAIEFVVGVFIVPSPNLFPKQSEVMMSHAPRAW
ncbi:MAG: hypothetical protein ACYC6X_02780 [Minisyncoccota bacterium]